MEREQLGQAAALGAVNMNLARAVGPVLGGAVVAASGAGRVFAFNSWPEHLAQHHSRPTATHSASVRAGRFRPVPSSRRTCPHHPNPGLANGPHGLPGRLVPFGDRLEKRDLVTVLLVITMLALLTAVLATGFPCC